MSAKVTVVCHSTGRSYSLDRKSADKKVKRGHFRWLDRFTVQEIPRSQELIKEHEMRTAYYSGPLSVGNLLPFTRIQNPMKHPPSINYPIPACGARTRPLSVKLNNLSRAQALELAESAARQLIASQQQPQL